MTDKKLKPAAKKAATSKTKTSIKKSSAVSSKPKATKTTAAAAAKKTAVKKKMATAATKPETPKVVKKMATPAMKPEMPKTPAVVKAAPLAVIKKTQLVKAAKPAAKPAPAERAVTKPEPEERYRMVETAAYFIAEQHGFQGRSDEHWAAAEREIAAKLGYPK